MKMNSDALLDAYQILTREIKIARQQSDARTMAYFNVEKLEQQKEACWKAIDAEIPDEFILQISIMTN
jgi:hypothetical protein